MIRRFNAGTESNKAARVAARNVRALDARSPLLPCAVGLLIGAAAILTGAPKASAQVAVPSIVPYNFVTENPAAMRWGTPSRVGIAYTQAQQTTSPATKHDNFEGYGAGFRLGGEYFALGAEGYHEESTNKPFSNPETQDNSAAGLAVGLWHWLALGASETTGTQKSVDLTSVGQPLPTLKITNDESLAGISIRLGTWLFLGGASGQQKGKFTDNLPSIPATVNATLTSDVTKYGVGIRTGGSIVTHLEAYEIDTSKPNISGFSSTSALITQSNLSSSISKQTQQTGVAEINLGGFLLSYSTSHFTQDSPQPTVDQQAAVIGYAPFSGLTVVLRGLQSVTKQHTSTSAISSTTYNQYAVALTYLFAAK